MDTTRTMHSNPLQHEDKRVLDCRLGMTTKIRIGVRRDTWMQDRFRRVCCREHRQGDCRLLMVSNLARRPGCSLSSRLDAYSCSLLSHCCVRPCYTLSFPLLSCSVLSGLITFHWSCSSFFFYINLIIHSLLKQTFLCILLHVFFYLLSTALDLTHRSY